MESGPTGRNGPVDSEHAPAEAIFQRDDVEIDQLADAVTRKAKIRHQRREMDWRDTVDRFDFHDLSLNDQVQPIVAVNLLAFGTDR